MAVFLCALTLVAAAGIFAEGEIFTISGNAGSPDCTYEMLTDPEGGTPGTAALIGYTVNPQWNDTSDLTLDGEVTSSEGDTYTVVQLGNGKDPLYNAEGGINPLRSLSVPDSVKSIKTNAFADYVGLETINGLSGNKNVVIEKDAFYGCFCLNEADLPKIGTQRNPNPFGDTVIEDFLEVRGILLYAGDGYEDEVLNNPVGVTKVLLNTDNEEQLEVRRLFAEHEQELRLWMNKYHAYYVTLNVITDLVNLSISPSGFVRNGEFTLNDYQMDVALDTDSSEESADKTFIRDSSPVYDIAEIDGDDPWNDQYMEFTFDCGDMTTDSVIFIIAAWQEAEFQGLTAPTIISPVDITVAADECVDFTLKATHTDNSFGNLTIGPYALPSQLHKQAETGEVRIYSELPMPEGFYTFLISATNGYAFDQKIITLTVGDPEADEEPEQPEPSDPQQLEAPQGLTWDVTMDEDAGKVTKNRAAWKPVENADSYILRLYKGSIETTPLVTTTVEGTGADMDVTYRDTDNAFTDAMNRYGYGRYIIQVIAAGGDAFSDSKPATDEYTYEYSVSPSVEKYRGTATTDGNGQVSLNAAASSSGVAVKEIDRGIEVTVEEGGTLIFDFMPSAGYELRSVMRDGSIDLGKKHSHTFSDINGSFTLHAAFGLISNRVEGITPEASYKQGEKLDFTAIGHNMDTVIKAEGETRWLPRWRSLDENAELQWSGGPYTGALDTSKLSIGEHVLTVMFQQQQYDEAGGSWKDVTDSTGYELKKITFKVEQADEEGTVADPDDPQDPTTENPDDADSPKDDASESDDPTDPGDPEKPAKTDDADDSNGSKDGEGAVSGEGTAGDSGITGVVGNIVDSVRTSDPMQLAVWSFVFVVSAICLLSFAAGKTGRKARRSAPPVDAHKSTHRKTS